MVEQKDWSKEDEKEWTRLCKEIARRNDWIARVDDRGTDPDYDLDEMKAEEEKYVRYEKELLGLREKFNELDKRCPKWETEEIIIEKDKPAIVVTEKEKRDRT